MSGLRAAQTALVGMPAGCNAKPAFERTLRSLQQRSYSKSANSMFKGSTCRKKVGDASPKGPLAKLVRRGGQVSSHGGVKRESGPKTSDQVLGSHNTPQDSGKAPTWNAPFLQFLDNLDAALPSGARHLESTTNADACLGR